MNTISSLIKLGMAVFFLILSLVMAPLANAADNQDNIELLEMESGLLPGGVRQEELKNSPVSGQQENKGPTGRNSRRNRLRVHDAPGKGL